MNHTPLSAAHAIRDRFNRSIPKTWEDRSDEFNAAERTPPFTPGARITESRWLNAYRAIGLVRELVNGTNPRTGVLNDGPCSYADANAAIRQAIPELFEDYWDRLLAQQAALAEKWERRISDLVRGPCDNSWNDGEEHALRKCLAELRAGAESAATGGSPSPSTGSVQWGWFVWCVGDDYREPEGTIFLDHEPRVGELVRLSDGKDWRIDRFNSEDLEMTVREIAPNSPIQAFISPNALAAACIVFILFVLLGLVLHSL